MNDAKEYLYQIRIKDEQINEKIQKVSELRASVSGTKSPVTTDDRVQASGKADRIADTIARIVDLEAEIDRMTDDLVQLKTDVMIVIRASGCNRNERKVLELHYFELVSIKLIGVRLHMHVRTVQRIHKSALEKIQTYCKMSSLDV